MDVCFLTLFLQPMLPCFCCDLFHKFPDNVRNNGGHFLFLDLFHRATPSQTCITHWQGVANEIHTYVQLYKFCRKKTHNNFTTQWQWHLLGQLWQAITHLEISVHDLNRLSKTQFFTAVQFFFFCTQILGIVPLFSNFLQLCNVIALLVCLWWI